MNNRLLAFFSAVQAKVKPLEDAASAVTTPAVVTSRTSWTPVQAVNHGYSRLADLAIVASGGTADVCTILCAGTTRDKLVTSGAAIATHRGSNDALLIYGNAIAFMDTAPPSLRVLVRFTREAVCAGVYAAIRAEANDEAVRARRIHHRVNAKADQGGLAGSMSMASILCTQLSDTLLTAAGDDRKIRAQIHAAVTPAAQGQSENHRGAALASLVTLGDLMLRSKDPDQIKQCSVAGLDREFLNKCQTAADHTNAAVTETERLLAYGTNAQAETDYWDGVNFYIMGRVVKAFATAHKLDARVPKLSFDKLKTRVARRRKKVEDVHPKDHTSAQHSAEAAAANTDGHTTQSKVA
jgi:hypothetical protein